MRHLTGAPLDRLDELRPDANVLLPDTRVLTLDADAARVLVHAGTPPRLATVPLSSLRPDTVDSLVLLGDLEGERWAARSVTASSGAVAGAGDFETIRGAASSLSALEAGLTVYAAGLLGWHRRARYCGECGAETAAAYAGHQRVCSRRGCEAVQYPRTDPAVITVVQRGERCLLISQPQWPAGRFAAVAGFVEPGESLEQAVAREVAEEVGLRVVGTEYLSSQPWPFPHSIMIGFRSIAAEGALRLGPEVRDARWFTRPELRRALAEGTATLSTPFSISRSLVDDWLG